MRLLFGLPELVLIVGTIAAIGLVVLPACRVCSKAGYPAGLGVAAIVPVANVLLLLFLAFSTWPLERGATSPRPATGPDRQPADRPTPGE